MAGGVRLERLGDPPNRVRLVGATRDLVVDRQGAQTLPTRPSLDEQPQLVLGEEALDLARRVVQVIPEIGVIAVGCGSSEVT